MNRRRDFHWPLCLLIPGPRPQTLDKPQASTNIASAMAADVWLGPYVGIPRRYYAAESTNYTPVTRSCLANTMLLSTYYIRSIFNNLIRCNARYIDTFCLCACTDTQPILRFTTGWSSRGRESVSGARTSLTPPPMLDAGAWKTGASTTSMMATGAGSSRVEEAGKTDVKSRTQRIMDGMPSSKQAMGAGGSSTYQV